MSKMGEIHAELDELGIPDSQKNAALFEKVSAGLKVAEKKIDGDKHEQTMTKLITRDKLVSLIKEYATTTGNVVHNNGRNYVTNAVWQFIASATGLVPSFECVKEGDAVVCTCTLYNRQQVEISKSTMMASKDESFLKEKDMFAVFGMAQTRALSRAVRNIYGYLVEQAGFQSTPLEEIIEKKGEQSGRIKRYN